MTKSYDKPAFKEEFLDLGANDQDSVQSHPVPSDELDLQWNSRGGKGPLFPVGQLFVSLEVRTVFQEAEIHDFIERHRLGEWGAYAVHWDMRNDDRCGQLSVCSCFFSDSIRLLVKTDAKGRRTVVRFECERLADRRYQRACYQAYRSSPQYRRFAMP